MRSYYVIPAPSCSADGKYQSGLDEIRLTEHFQGNLWKSADCIYRNMSMWTVHVSDSWWISLPWLCNPAQSHQWPAHLPFVIFLSWDLKGFSVLHFLQMAGRNLIKTETWHQSRYCLMLVPEERGHYWFCVKQGIEHDNTEYIYGCTVILLPSSTTQNNDDGLNAWSRCMQFRRNSSLIKKILALYTSSFECATNYSGMKKLFVWPCPLSLNNEIHLPRVELLVWTVFSSA